MKESSDELKQLIFSCIEIEPENRPTVNDILEHNWMKMFLVKLYEERFKNYDDVKPIEKIGDLISSDEEVD